ncbi:hypothetical protein AGDE_17211 [Angomonas deanei]|nr:hypothetical protein AGDE_17211 [Angomonas deanei]|eukprot:EPY15036.1 hypothetical protein AGDE_17211 [Angomonas deanei]
MKAADPSKAKNTNLCLLSDDSGNIVMKPMLKVLGKNNNNNNPKLLSPVDKTPLFGDFHRDSVSDPNNNSLTKKERLASLHAFSPLGKEKLIVDAVANSNSFSITSLTRRNAGKTGTPSAAPIPSKTSPAEGSHNNSLLVNEDSLKEYVKFVD